MNLLELSRNLVLVASGNMGSGNMGMNRGNGTPAVPSRQIALSVDSGSVQWQVNLDGVVTAIEPFAGGVYAMIVRYDGTRAGSGMHNGANGATLMKRSVAAIDNASSVLWKIDLD